jgi:NADH-quinone oxidoreductase subunit M
MRWTEGQVIAPLLFLIVFLGLYPAPMLERIEPSVRALVAHVDEQVDDFEAVEIDYVGASDVPEPSHGEEEGE